MGTFVCLFVISGIQAVLENLAPRTVPSLLVSVMGASLGACLLWAVLRDRIKAPPSIWVVLATLFVSNVLVMVAFGFSLAIGLERMPELAGELTREVLEIATPGGLAAAIAARQISVLCAAALAYALRDSASPLQSRRGRVALSVFVAMVLVPSAFMFWFAPRTAYQFTGGVGRTATVSGGEQVPLIGGLGDVETPAAWRGDSTTPLTPPPVWFFVEEVEPPVAQVVYLFDGSKGATTPIDSDTCLLVSVCDDQESWRALGSTQTSDNARVVIPSSLLRGRVSSAWLRTSAASESGRWRTMLRVGVPDDRVPLMITVLIRHKSQEPPPLSRFYEVLECVHLRH